MKFKITTLYRDKVISETEIDAPMLEFPGRAGDFSTKLTFITIKWEMLDNEENNKELEEFIKKYPSREAFLSTRE